MSDANARAAVVRRCRAAVVRRCRATVVRRLCYGASDQALERRLTDAKTAFYTIFRIKRGSKKRFDRFLYDFSYKTRL